MDTYFRSQALEERRRPLVFDEIPDDSKPRHLLLKVRILYTRLHRIERRRDRYRRDRPGDGRDEVLRPRRLRVVRHTERILFRYRRCTEELRIAAMLECDKGREVYVHRLTAKLPGAFRAIVHPQPRYSVVPSSMKIRRNPRPRNASGLT